MGGIAALPGFPIAPCILGLVLGGIVEQNLVASMIRAHGNVLFFFHRPLAAVLGVLAILVWTAPLVLWAARSLARVRSCRRRPRR